MLPSGSLKKKKGLHAKYGGQSIRLRVQWQTYTRRLGACCHEPEVPRCSKVKSRREKESAMLWGEHRRSSRVLWGERGRSSIESPPAFGVKTGWKEPMSAQLGQGTRPIGGWGSCWRLSSNVPADSTLRTNHKEATIGGVAHTREKVPDRMGGRCKR